LKKRGPIEALGEFAQFLALKKFPRLKKRGPIEAKFTGTYFNQRTFNFRA